MSTKSKPTTLALGAALVGGLALGGSAFAMQPLAQGYMLAAADVAEGSCGGKTADGKAAEGSCGGKTAEGSCGADKKAHASEGRCGLEAMDANKDGRVSKAEYAAAHKKDVETQFAAHDANKDGFLTADELKAHMGGSGGTSKAMEEGKCGEGKCGASG